MMVMPFPKPGPMLRQAFKELDVLAYGSDEEGKALGDTTALARPWDPSSVTNPRLRQQLWEWLDRVVVWTNHEYGWRAEDLIPGCWPHHPPLVREIAVVADLRRRAGAAATSDSLEEWHRYALPAFLDRMGRRSSTSNCIEKHQDWPARGRYTRHVSEDCRTARGTQFNTDLDEITRLHEDAERRRARQQAASAAPVASPPDSQEITPLRLVNDEHAMADTTTGEVLE